MLLKANKYTQSSVPKLNFNQEEYREFLSSFPDGKEFVIEIEEKRTLDQNNCLWGWANVIAQEQGISTEQSFEDMVIINFGYIIMYNDDDTQIIKPISTSSLSKEYFTKCLNRTQIWANETLNIELPDIINDYKTIKL